MSARRWKREGRTAGPANVLDGRLEVARRGGRWVVRDRHLGRLVGHAHGHRTMREAKGEAERIAELRDAVRLTDPGTAARIAERGRPVSRLDRLVAFTDAHADEEAGR